MQLDTEAIMPNKNRGDMHYFKPNMEGFDKL